MNTNVALHINELRIGSIINGYKLTEGWKPFVVTGNNIQQFEREIAGIFSKDCPKGIDNIEPIPLTPEILEKCGFVLSYDDKFKNEKYFKKDGFDDLADYGGQSIVLTDKGNYLECGYYDNQITCESIHQLQNLYFALTGEELNVQL